MALSASINLITLDASHSGMKCSKCRKLIEGRSIKFAIEGDWMGKPLCRKCKAEVEEESREKYRRGMGREHSTENHYGLDVYRRRSDD